MVVRPLGLAVTESFLVLASDGLWDVMSNEVGCLTYLPRTSVLTIRATTLCNQSNQKKAYVSQHPDTEPEPQAGPLSLSPNSRAPKSRWRTLVLREEAFCGTKCRPLAPAPTASRTPAERRP